MNKTDLTTAYLAPSPDPRDTFSFAVARLCGDAKAQGWRMTESECIDEAIALLGSDDASGLDRARRVGSRVFRALYT